MKIKKLVITAFGPYASRQELDFEKNLEDKNMFVITGNTGAGKTTIFDAINFALYGDPSGSDRESKSLRSDFADPQTPTEVELWFSLREKDYYVKRTPVYIKPKQRGEGFVENKPSAEIKLPKDKTITGVNQVTKEVESILGITKEQFKQLVMIPQGEFKKLLNAKSDEKEDIFRKIFGTEIFQSIQNQIKQQANKLEKGIREVRRDRLNKIKSFNCKDKDEDLFRLINADSPNIENIIKSFYEFIERDKEEKSKLEEKLKEESKLIEKISNEITAGKATNDAFEKVEKNKDELDKLNKQVEEYDNKKLQVKWGEKALTVKGYEDKYNEKNKDFKTLEADLKVIDKNIETYKQSYTKAEEEFNKQKGREEEKNNLNNDIVENQRLKEKASEYEENKSKAKTLEEKVNKIKGRINEIGSLTGDNNEKVKLINDELEYIKKAKADKGALDIEQLNYKNKKENLTKLISDIDLWIKEKEKHKKVSNNFEEIDSKFKVAKEKYELLEDTFRKNQAGILASKLEDGMACPVCGSIHHPKLAILEDREITEESVKNSKKLLENYRSERDEKLNELTEINSYLNTIKNKSIDPIIKELLNKDNDYDVMDIKCEVNELFVKNNTLLLELNSKIQNLIDIINKENEKIKSRNDMEKNNDELRKELELKNGEYAKEDGNLRVARSTLDNIRNEFKGEIKTVRELEEIIKSLRDKLQTIKNEYEKANKEFTDIKSTLNQEEGRQKSTNQMKEKTYKELQEAIDIFKKETLELGFADGNDYKAKSLTKEKIESITKQINDFNTNLASVKKLYEVSVKEIENLKVVDLVILKENLDKEKRNEVDLNKENLIIFSRISHNIFIIEACEKCNKDIESDEKKYEIIGRLSNVVNGENSKKISFERYVLASYFENIIAAANIRFQKMTSGRFELLRKQEIGDMRKGQGLELEVFDNYTGKARDVKTLSGGESFKASLSMALGLADVVQAYSGGIQLDTMFIDEGFGTLDPESLDNAIECLMDLQNDGRLVGIISHVPELKERIDARLEVTTTNKGSMAEFRV